MEFRILGPLEVRDDADPISIGGPKQRALLAILLLNAGRVVSRDQLVGELWSDQSPEAARHTLDVSVSRLRKALSGTGDTTTRLVTQAPGYAFHLNGDTLDLNEFEELLEEGRAQLAAGHAAEAAETLRAAERLWRGRALADLEFEPFARVEVDRLEELRLTATEERIAAELALGRHAALVGELEALTAEHPLRERLRGQLMLALYRSGRQAEALETYRKGRAYLVEELGLEPSANLRGLEQAILQQDAALDVDGPAPPERPPALTASPAAAPRHRPSSRVLAAVALALLLAGAVVFLATRSANHQRVTQTPALPVGAVSIDAASGSPINTAAVPFGAEARYAAGFFWVANQLPPALAKIDPHNGRLLKQIASPATYGPNYFRIDGSYAWFADWDGPHLFKVDLQSGRVVLRVTLSRLAHDTRRTVLAGVAGGSVWAGVWRTGELFRIDARSGHVLHRFRGFTGIDGGEADSAGAWISTPDRLTHIDASTNAVTAVARIPGSHQYVALGGGYAWTSNPLKGEVYKIDREGHLAATYTTGAAAWRVAYADGRAWVANTLAETITSIDATTGAMRTYRTGHLPLAIAAGAGHALVATIPFHDVLKQVTSMRGPVARIVVPPYVFATPDPAGAEPNPFKFQVEQATEAKLFNYPDAQPPRGLRPIPELAAGPPRISAHGRLYTFRVRRGFRFSPPSGVRVTAATVRASLERSISPQLGRDAPAFEFLRDVVGASSFHAGHTSHVSGIRVHGNSLSIALKRPSGDLVERLALPYFAVVPPTAPIAPNGEAGVPAQPYAPPSAGPYYVAAGNEPGFTILRRNPYYRGPRPHRLQAIGVIDVVSPGSGAALLRRHEVDAVEAPDPTLAPRSALAAKPPAQSSFVAGALERTHFLALNMRTGIFASRGVREAAARAISRPTLAGLWGTSTGGNPELGTLEASAQILPPNVRGYMRREPFALDPSPAVKPAEGTRRKVAVMAVVRNCDPCTNSFESVRASLGRIGIDVRARPVWSLADVRERPRGFDLFDDEASLDFPDPASFLTRMFTKNIPASWLQPSVAQSIRRLESLAGIERDRAAATLANRLEVSDVPVLAVGYPVIGQVYSQRLGCRTFQGFRVGVDLAALCRN